MFVAQLWYIIAVAISCDHKNVHGTSMVLTLAWLVSFVSAASFQRWPLRCNWVERTSSTNDSIMYLCSGLTDVLLDAAFLCILVSFMGEFKISRG